MTESDPRGALKRLAERTGGQFPNLWDARSLTEQELARVVKEVGRLSHDPDVRVGLFGSWARMELTPHSDDDWLILIDGRKRRELSPTLADVGRIIGTEKRKPGKQKVFGIVASCNEMANKIGLNHDTNANLTRRVLLMLESVPVSNAAAHKACWDGVFDCYLREAHSGRPPRFLLNDVVRYWRTICVDFVGKQRESEAKWGTRNAKLRTSRKILFAAGLLPILQCTGSILSSLEPFSFRSFALRRPTAWRMPFWPGVPPTKARAAWRLTTGGSGC